MTDPWRVPVSQRGGNNNANNNVAGPRANDWAALLAQAQHTVPQDEAPRIRRTLHGIERESARLASRHTTRVPASQLHSYAEERNVDIRGQTDYVNNLDESKLNVPDDDRFAGANDGPSRQPFDDTLMTPSQRRMPRDAAGGETAAALLGTAARGGRQAAMIPTPSQFQAQLQHQMPRGIGPNDLQSILKYHHEYVVSSTIQECHLLSGRHFRKKLNESLESEWDNTKNDILDYLGCQRGAATVSGLKTRPELMINTPSQKSLLHSVSTTKTRRRLGDPFVPSQNNNMNGNDHDSDDDVMNQMGQTQHVSQRQRQQEQNSMASGRQEQGLTEWEREFAKVVAELARGRRLVAPVIDVIAESKNNMDNDPIRGGLQLKENCMTPFTRFFDIHEKLESSFYDQYRADQREQTEASRDRLRACHMIWDVLRWMTQESGVLSAGMSDANNGSTLLLKEFEFYDTYVGAMKAPSGEKHVGLQRMLLDGTRKYLESEFWEYMQHEVAHKKDICQLGGNPSKMAYVKAFLRCKMHGNRNQFMQGIVHKSMFPVGAGDTEVLPTFALIYYSYRIGELDAAIEFCNRNKINTVRILCALESIRNQTLELAKDRNNVLAGGRAQHGRNDQTIDLDLTQDHMDISHGAQVTGQPMVDVYALNDIKLDDETWKNLDSYFKQEVQHKSHDPYELLMYAILGRFGMSADNYARIQPLLTTDDYLWLRLCCLIETPSDLPQWLPKNAPKLAPVTLPVLQQEIHEQDWKMFSKTNQFWYALYLIQTQQFERCVDFLFTQGCDMEAVHLGLSLRHYGLLQTTCDDPVHGTSSDLTGKVKIYAQKLLSKARYCISLEHSGRSPFNAARPNDSLGMNINDLYRYFFVYLYLLDEKRVLGPRVEQALLGETHNNPSVRDHRRIQLSVQMSQSLQFVIEKLAEPAVSDVRFLRTLMGDVANVANVSSVGNVANAGGSREEKNEDQSGVMRVFVGTERFEEILAQAGEEANRKGNKLLAMRFFMGGRWFDPACRIIVSLLAAVAKEKKFHPEKKNILNFATVLYRTEGHLRADTSQGQDRLLPDRLRHNLVCLIRICEFYNDVGEGRLDNALNVIKSAGIVPLYEVFEDVGAEIASGQRAEPMDTGGDGGNPSNAGMGANGANGAGAGWFGLNWLGGNAGRGAANGRNGGVGLNLALKDKNDTKWIAEKISFGNLEYLKSYKNAILNLVDEVQRHVAGVIATVMEIVAGKVLKQKQLVSMTEVNIQNSSQYREMRQNSDMCKIIYHFYNHLRIAKSDVESKQVTELFTKANVDRMDTMNNRWQQY